MRTNNISPFDQHEPKHGVAVADGWGIRIHIHQGHLTIDDGIGRTRRERRFHKATSGLTRLVIIGRTGYITLEAIRWLADAGISLTHLDTDSRILATSPGRQGADKAALRRAQAWAATNQTGLDIIRWILTHKLEGQASIARRLGADPTDIETAITRLDDESTPDDLMFLEASAAATYWQTWRDQPITYVRQDESSVPDHWRTFGTRSSQITGSPRLATNPANAILNYLYAILEAETRNACIAVGLDPGIGILHADQPNRDSLALDLMEAVRPDIDTYLLDLLNQHGFRVRDFHDTRRGTCRINPPLAHQLAETAPTWAKRIAPTAEHVAKQLARTPGIRTTRVATPLTQTNRSSGRSNSRRADPAERASRPPGPQRHCQDCGLEIASDRKLCPDCRTAHQTDKVERMNVQGLETLARLRQQGQDPAHGREAATKRAASMTRQNAASAEWELHNERPDPEIWQTEILPGLASVTLKQMMDATGLSSGYCSMIRQGDKTPHPRHWEPLRDLTSDTNGS